MVRKIIALVTVLLLFVAACTPSANPKNYLEKPCNENKDCLKVASGCCGCVNGGIDKAISNNRLEEYHAERKVECKNVLCPKVISNDISCSLNPECIEGTCKLK